MQGQHLLLAVRAAANEPPGCWYQGRHATEADVEPIQKASGPTVQSDLKEILIKDKRLDAEAVLRTGGSADAVMMCSVQRITARK